MIFFVLAITLLALLTSKFNFEAPHLDYISAQRTLPIKGAFVLLVFASHFCSYVEFENVYDKAYLVFRSFMGQLIVAPFLFYSGYGVLLSVIKKGEEYAKGLPLKRIFKVWLQFNCAVALFLVVQVLRGKRYTLGHMALTSIGWAGIGNSNWYIFCVLFLYLFVWMAAMAFSAEQPKDRFPMLATVTILTVCFVYVVAKLKGAAGSYYYNTAIVFVAGGWYAAYQVKIEKFVLDNRKRFWLIMLVTALAFFILHKERGALIWYEFHAVAFSVLVVLLTMVVQIRSRFLTYCGKHLFSLYILQRLPMMVFQGTELAKYNYSYFAVCVVCTFLLSAAFDFGFDKLWKPIQDGLLALAGFGKNRQEK